MTQELINSGLGLATALIVAVLTGCVKSYVSLRDDVNRIKNTLSMMSEVAARALHSPTNHLGLDNYVDLYLEHDCDMPNGKWEEFKQLLQAILDDRTKTTGERNTAGMLLALTYHKLKQPIPPKHKLKASP